MGGFRSDEEGGSWGGIVEGWGDEGCEELQGAAGRRECNSCWEEKRIEQHRRLDIPRHVLRSAIGESSVNSFGGKALG